MITHNKIHSQQQGAALLLIILVLFTSISTMILAMANNQSPYLQQKFEIRDELNIAKEMLLAYAMQYPDISGTGNGPGRLPCPDIDNGEFPETSCSTSVDSFQGRLPQRLNPSLGQVLTFHNKYAGIDQQFWYAVDPNFHTSAASVNSNSTVSGLFTLDGTGAGNIVAVIIAPGEAVSGQDRSSSTVNDNNYLEGGNENGTSYVSSYNLDPDNFNDQVITITKNELMTMATNRVIQEIKKELDSYYALSRYYRDSIPADPLLTCYSPYYWGQTYPRDFTYRGEYYYPGPVCVWENEDTMFGDTYTQSAMYGAASWFSNDGWDTITTYTNISNTQATVSFAGCGITYTFNYSGGESNISRSQPEC